LRAIRDRIGHDVKPNRAAEARDLLACPGRAIRQLLAEVGAHVDPAAAEALALSRVGIDAVTHGVPPGSPSC
jgi:hypothetical protein